MYIFETHPQHDLDGSVFFKDQSTNAGFIALIPFDKIAKGLYRIGFCHGSFVHFEEKFISKNKGPFFKTDPS
jgi:hypothetical protein